MDEPYAQTEAFREAMRHVASTVVIVSTRHNSQDYGMTATAFAPVSMTPPTLLVAINEGASIHAPLSLSDGFCINVLNITHEDHSRTFSSRAMAAERFKSPGWQLSVDNLPFLEGAQANFFCRPLERYKVGTHTLFIGEVFRVTASGRPAPLIYLDGAFRRAAETECMSLTTS
jgi:flavin reductase (DIM6/NTAB) family NADH-FMN oxidoreductase RutF